MTEQIKAEAIETKQVMTDLELIKEDIYKGYKYVMTGLAKKWGNTLDADTLRLLFLKEISVHICDRTTGVIAVNNLKLKKYQEIKKIMVEK